MSQHKFTGYRRENGRVGIRNHVIILPLDDLSNAACEEPAPTNNAAKASDSATNARPTIFMGVP